MSTMSLLKTCGVAIATAIVLSGCLGDSDGGGDMVLMGYYEATVSHEGEPVPTLASGADRQLKALQDAGIQASIYKCATVTPAPAGVDQNGDPLIGVGFFQDVVLYRVPADQVTAAEGLSMIVTKQGPGEALDPARTTYYDCHNPGWWWEARNLAACLIGKFRTEMLIVQSIALFKAAVSTATNADIANWLIANSPRTVAGIPVVRNPPTAPH